MFNLFKRHKNKKKFKEVTEKYDADVLMEERLKDGDFVKRYIVEQCEQMTNAATELADLKIEYKNLTSYLTDIQIIDNMDTEDHEKLLDLATNIQNITKAKESMLKTVNNLPDSRYNELDMMGEEVLKAVSRLRDNEKLKDVFEKDLKYLDGEKIEWQYEKHAIEGEQKTLRKLIIGLVFVIGLTATGFFGLKLGLNDQRSNILLIILLISGLIECGLLLRIQNNKRDIVQCNVNYNKAVSIQNSIKFRYVNIKNAVDYAHDKYHTRSAQELENDWQKYLESKKEREKLLAANEDLEFYRSSMIHLLRSYNLYDASIWPYQTVALLNPREMVEVKHSELEKRQKVRNRMQEMAAQVDEIKTVVKKLSEEKDILTNEVNSMIRTVEKVTGDI